MSNNLYKQYQYNISQNKVIDPLEVVCDPIDLPITFEQFVQNKAEAFKYFMKEPCLQHLINQEDVNNFQKIHFQIIKYNVSSVILCFTIQMCSQKYLKKSNIIYGLTIKDTSSANLKRMIKYQFNSLLITSIFDKCFLSPIMTKKFNLILLKYDFTLPEYQQVYEGYKMMKTLRK